MPRGPGPRLRGAPRTGGVQIRGAWGAGAFGGVGIIPRAESQWHQGTPRSRSRGGSPRSGGRVEWDSADPKRNRAERPNRSVDAGDAPSPPITKEKIMNVLDLQSLPTGVRPTGVRLSTWSSGCNVQWSTWSAGCRK